MSKNADRTVRNKYKLHSVLVHSGGVHGGHYYAFIRPDGENWLKFDDEKVCAVHSRGLVQYWLFSTVLVLALDLGCICSDLGSLCPGGASRAIPCICLDALVWRSLPSAAVRTSRSRQGTMFEFVVGPGCPVWAWAVRISTHCFWGRSLSFAGSMLFLSPRSSWRMLLYRSPKGFLCT